MWRPLNNDNTHLGVGRRCVLSLFKWYHMYTSDRPRKVCGNQHKKHSSHMPVCGHPVAAVHSLDLSGVGSTWLRRVGVLCACAPHAVPHSKWSLAGWSRGGQCVHSRRPVAVLHHPRKAIWSTTTARAPAAQSCTWWRDRAASTGSI